MVALDVEAQGAGDGVQHRLGDVGVAAALEADLADGQRRVPLTEFDLIPGDRPDKENILEHGELITRVDISLPATGTGSGFLKVRDRASYEFALTSGAAVLVVRDGTITTARLALGGVGTIPWRAREAEAVLVGAPANDQSFRAAAEAAIRDPFTVPGAAFKVELAKHTIVRVLQTVIAGDEQSPLWGRQRADVTVTNGRIHPAGDPSSGATHRDILTRHGLDELVAAPAREQGPPGGHQQRERPAGRAVQ